MKKLFNYFRNARGSKSTVLASVAAIAATLFGAEMVVAMGSVTPSGDTTFDDATSMLTNWSTGSFGKLASVAALIVGMAFGIIRGTIVAVVGSIAIAVTLYLGPQILDGIFSAGLPAAA